MASTPGFETGPHWWETNALTTAPPLLPLLPLAACLAMIIIMICEFYLTLLKRFLNGKISCIKNSILKTGFLLINFFYFFVFFVFFIIRGIVISWRQQWVILTNYSPLNSCPIFVPIAKFPLLLLNYFLKTSNFNKKTSLVLLFYRFVHINLCRAGISTP